MEFGHKINCTYFFFFFFADTKCRYNGYDCITCVAPFTAFQQLFLVIFECVKKVAATIDQWNFIKAYTLAQHIAWHSKRVNNNKLKENKNCSRKKKQTNKKCMWYLYSSIWPDFISFRIFIIICWCWCCCCRRRYLLR